MVSGRHEKERLRVGVLALQGAFREHRAMLELCGAEVVEIRLPLDPADAEVSDIALAIDVSGGVLRVSWDPALPGRAYTLYGCDEISTSASWYVVPTNELDTTSARFFRLSIGQQP